MDELIQAMSIAELQTFKTTYQENASIQTIIDGYIEVKVKQETQAKAKNAFGNQISKMVDKLPHPDDVHNVYLAWREVDVEDTSQEPEMVDVVVTQAVVDGAGNITTPAAIEPQPRYPTHKVYQWVVELNKGFQVGRVANNQPTTNKRAITLHKRNGVSLELVGNFTSASKACDHLKITIGGDSAPRVLARDGYILDPYTGTDYIS